MKKIVVIHFNPLELYPPVQNFLHYAGNHFFATSISVLTTATTNTAFHEFQSPSSNIRIVRLGRSGLKMPALRRYANFIVFYLGCLWHLVKKKPSGILYYETLSSLPAFLYKKMCKKSVEIFIHYHEYTSKEEYAGGTKLLKFFHYLEKLLYPAAQWVSHTNKYRMEYFEKDIFPGVIPVKKILPNYPPRSWFFPPKGAIQKPVKIVYVGALSMHTMYTEEFVDWVIQQNGNVTWDIYTTNIKEKAKIFFDKLQSDFITLKEGVNYDELPLILKNYDVGVILYQGIIANHIFSAPNKLFEYLACGLDVWFPLTLKGSFSYITQAGLSQSNSIGFYFVTAF